MKTIEEQLDKLGIEYRVNMEKNKDESFPELMLALCELFQCTKAVNEAQESFPMIIFLKAFYDAGFYKGLNYGIDSMENWVVDDNDLLVKYQDEINQEILEKVRTNDNENIFIK